jgi:hypothetical protein
MAGVGLRYLPADLLTNAIRHGRHNTPPCPIHVAFLMGCCLTLRLERTGVEAARRQPYEAAAGCPAAGR